MALSVSGNCSRWWIVGSQKIIDILVDAERASRETNNT
jgi:hypothetical protein